MSDQSVLIEVLQQQARKRNDRRQFFRKSGGVAVGMAGGMILSACGGSAQCDGESRHDRPTTRSSTSH